MRATSDENAESGSQTVLSTVEGALDDRWTYEPTFLGRMLVYVALATLGAVLFPTLRTLLLALGATGLFTALLIYYITPERFVSAGVGRAVHAALATNHEAVVRELDLGGDPRYVPLGEAGADVRLFVSREAGTPVPPAEELRSLFVVSDEADHRGVAFDPTGAALFEEFERALAGSLEDSLPALADQLRDALVEQFEIVDRIDFEAGEAGRLVVDVRGSAYGPIDRFDDPVTSFVGVGLAKATERPITLRSVDPDAGVVEFRWDHAGTTREPNPDA